MTNKLQLLQVARKHLWVGLGVRPVGRGCWPYICYAVESAGVDLQAPIRLTTEVTQAIQWQLAHPNNPKMHCYSFDGWLAVLRVDPEKIDNDLWLQTCRHLWLDDLIAEELGKPRIHVPDGYIVPERLTVT